MKTLLDKWESLELLAKNFKIFIQENSMDFYYDKTKSIFLI
jgi:hypothetical protein